MTNRKVEIIVPAQAVVETRHVGPLVFMTISGEARGAQVNAGLTIGGVTIASESTVELAFADPAQAGRVAKALTEAV